MSLRNFSTHTLRTRLTIRVDIGSRKCTSMNPVIHYRKDSRRSRLSRTLKRSLTTLPKSSALLLGRHGACIAEQRYLTPWAYWSFIENRSPRSLRAWRYQQGRRLWTQVHTFGTALAGTLYMLTIHGYREAGHDVSVASSAAPSLSRYSLSHPFSLPSPWCVCMPCLVNVTSFPFPVDTTPKYCHWRQ